MGMTGDDSRKSGELRVEVQCLEVVQHVEVEAPGLDDVEGGQRSGPRPGIDVSSDRKSRRDGAKPLEHFRPADVAGVDDQRRPLQRVGGFWTQQAVGIRDDADGEHSAWPSRRSIS